jgi:hypothetical protein
MTLRLALPLAAAALLAMSATVPTDAGARATTGDLAAQLTAIRGGSGGTAFTIRCPKGSVLTGFVAQIGLYLDQLKIKCTEVRADGTLGGETPGTGVAGGTGGFDFPRDSCDAGTVPGTGTVSYGSFVHAVWLKCYPWKPATRSFDRYATSNSLVVGRVTGPKEDGFSCTNATQPVVGIRGREGNYVDAIGFVCDEP